MTSRERVLNTFHRVKADRIPMDFSANPSILRKLMAALNVVDFEKLLSVLQIDFRSVGVPYVGKPLFPEKPGLWVDPVYGFYCHWVENDWGGYNDFCEFPLQGADSEVIAAFPVPDPDDFDYSGVYDYVSQMEDYACFVGNAGFADVINSAGRVMGMEDILVNLMTEDEGTMTYINRVADMQLGQLERTIEAGKGKFTFLWMGEDLGTQHSPMISLELYRKLLRPIHQKFIDLAKSYDLPVMVHSCGSSSWVYEDFIEMGVDAVDTLQPEATNMSPGYLAEHFGGRLSFHGCISTAGPLAYGSPDEVEKQVRETIEIMKPNCGYMLSPAHMIQDNSPVENVLRMYEAGLRYGKYE